MALSHRLGPTKEMAAAVRGAAVPPTAPTRRRRGWPLVRRIATILAIPVVVLAIAAGTATLAAQPAPMEEEYATQLPKTFHHGLPPSSLELGIVNHLYPPTNLFLEPPLWGWTRDGETPLQTASAIVYAAENVKQLAIDLKQSIWSHSAAAEERRPAVAMVYVADMRAPLVPQELRPMTH